MSDFAKDMLLIVGIWFAIVAIPTITGIILTIIMRDGGDDCE